ncbi:unnamed protein product [Protopolystoma xenopodis]|uniref:Uncharacterized protein n=1 Tax=Protopolystoma xenopodis TaxID=117903 RepID=A0A3S5A480_9PLAT|nr:unnamed protein product [Protopolystoma xenopodis]
MLGKEKMKNYLGRENHNAWPSEEQMGPGCLWESKKSTILHRTIRAGTTMSFGAPLHRALTHHLSSLLLQGSG